MSAPPRPSPRRRRFAARLHAVQALFQMEASGQSVDAVLREFEEHRLGKPLDEDAIVEGDAELFGALVETAVNIQPRVDQATDRALVEKWPIERIDPTLRALFRAAGAELSTDTPPKVVISEFVEVAKAFFPEGREPQFANAVLDHMAREMRPEAFAAKA